MKWLKVFIFVFAAVIATAMPATVLAQPPTVTPPPTPAASLKLNTTFPRLEVRSGDSVAFDVMINYIAPDDNAKPKLFDLVVTPPKDWTGYITPAYPIDKRIASVQIDPASGGSQGIIVNAVPSVYQNPKPGNYTVRVDVNSSDLKASIELTVVVTASYSMIMNPAGDPPLYNTTATASKEKVYSINVQNTGSAPINTVVLAADKPQDWSVQFSPEKIESLDSGTSRTVDVKIKPPSNTIAGDYSLTLRANGTQTSAQSMEIRVTVQTPAIWGWVGVAIIILVVLALGYVFIRFSRR